MNHILWFFSLSCWERAGMRALSVCCRLPSLFPSPSRLIFTRILPPPIRTFPRQRGRDTWVGQECPGSRCRYSAAPRKGGETLTHPCSLSAISLQVPHWHFNDACSVVKVPSQPLLFLTPSLMTRILITQEMPPPVPLQINFDVPFWHHNRRSSWKRC